MHIVISGYYGFDNVGDEAILFSIIEGLRRVQPNVEITVLSNQPKSTAETYQVHAVDRWKVSEVSQAIKQSDGLISGGGSLLQDKTGLKSIPYYAGVMKIAQWHKKPVFIYAQGMGPISHPFSKWLTKLIVNKVDMITVRDTASAQLLSDIGITKDVTIVPDPVLGLDGLAFTNDWVIESGITKSFIAVSVREWSTDEPFKEKIANSLDDLARNGYAIVFIPMHGALDEVTSQEVADLMTEKSYMAPGDLSIEEKIAIIGESDLLIGMRLHSIIFAAVTYVPFVALSYDPKVDAFSEICDQPVAGHVAESDWTSESLLKTVQQSLKNLEAVQYALEERVKVHQELARNTPKQVFETFSKKKE